MSTSQKKVKNKKLSGTIIVVLAILSVVGLLFFFIAKANCEKAFIETFDTERQNTYDMFKNMSFSFFEQQNHVSNRATISIGDIKKENSLEVLEVSDTWLKINEAGNEDDRLKRWVEFSATGVYTVDLSTSEFIIDDINKYVCVRLKTPKLNHVSINENAKIYMLEYDADWLKLKFNGDYNTGFAEYTEDRKEAQSKLTEQLANRDSNLSLAKESANKFIKSFIISVNPDLDLQDSNINIEWI